ncbi:hypothetical protein [Paenibacillus sp. yr247]|uniref:hypothetical protein n=1 Tax=Paenibacillus sp. yr247 TaxID=1761880 RepID=UPI0011400F49|nr:hypothetical protein [Paenibacillus sp. yr247]
MEKPDSGPIETVDYVKLANGWFRPLIANRYDVVMFIQVSNSVLNVWIMESETLDSLNVSSLSLGNNTNSKYAAYLNNWELFRQ